MSIDLETQVGELFTRMITELTDESSVVVHWVAVVDVRRTDDDSVIGTLAPSGMPSWMIRAMVNEAAEAEYQEYASGDDDDED